MRQAFDPEFHRCHMVQFGPTSIRISFPFSPEAVEAIKTLPFPVRGYSKERREWVVLGEEWVPQAITLLQGVFGAERVWIDYGGHGPYDWTAKKREEEARAKRAREEERRRKQRAEYEQFTGGRRQAASPRTSGSDPYATLYVTRDAPQEVIKAAYQALARIWHPDKHPDKETATRRMQAINAAYDQVKR